MISYSILVNTTDRFEDCWLPFFTLFKKYWSTYSGKIYLNTETKSYQFKNLNIIPVKNNSEQTKKDITWSECLVRALDLINDEIILYLQEDYFFKDFVQEEIIDNYVELMHKNSEIDCIQLTDQAVIPDTYSKYEGLKRVKRKQRYEVSCQAALWRKDTLFKLIRPYESAWQFEEFGSKRAAVLKPNFYVVDENLVQLGRNEIVPYIFTGIIQGQWNEDVVDLFSSNDIDVNFSVRGFIDLNKKKSLNLRILMKIKRFHVFLRYIIDLLFRLNVRK